MEKKKLYIAYGSNMNEGQMSFRCPTARIVGKSSIKDYELLFRGRKHSAVATIEPKEGFEVPVLLWEIYPEDERALDHYEGYPHLYTKKNFEIELNGKAVSAMAYIMNDGYSIGVPSPTYTGIIHHGYVTHDIPLKTLLNAVKKANNITKGILFK